MYKIKCDTHTHTIYSRHAYSTIEENVRAASEAGLELLTATDHFSAMLWPEQDFRNFQYLSNMSGWPRLWHGVSLLRGAEADIIDLEGHLFGHGIPVTHGIVGYAFKTVKDLDEKILGGLDYTIASVHGKAFTEGASIVQKTEMYIKALDNPHVFILGHIGRSGVEFDLDEVLLAAKARNKLIEINEHSFHIAPQYHTRCRSIAERCAELGVMISVSTDAHISCAVGKFGKCSEMLEEIHFPEELIAGRDRAHFLEMLGKSGVATLTEDDFKEEA
ncbi:MAG: phosphatase [Eubacteriales bacterium]|nr:phosphatase [Eubacteriales bacterium]